MSRGAVVAAEMTDQVRDTIMTSWQRSWQWNVSAGHIDADLTNSQCTYHMSLTRG